MVWELQAADPQKLGPYQLLRRLGGGGMGRVFLGRSVGGRLVAVKVIRSELADDPSFRARFSHEVAAAQKVGGLYTALVVDADPDGPVPWLATAYVAGPSLAEAVTGHGPLPPASVLALAAGLAEGLGAIHAAGVVHRDLKPSNVLLAHDGPRVIDFGISRAAEASALTSTGLVVGSPGFMSPEQAEGHEVGPPSDVFSLGAVLAFAATGEGPFGTGSTAALIYRIVHGQPNIGHLPNPIRPIIERCLAKNPQQRPTTPALLAELGATPLVADWLPASFARVFARYAPPGPAYVRDDSGDSPARVATEIAAVPGVAPVGRPDGPSTVTAARPHRAVPDGTLPAKPGGPAGQPSPRRQSRRGWAWATGTLITASVLALGALALTTFKHGTAQPGRAGRTVASAGYGAAISKVVNPSSRKGGTIIYDSSTLDSADPGNTYYTSNWDFTRLYAMPLMTYKSCPGACGLQIVPDLATAPGSVSDHGLTWTYHIQPDVKFEDGTTVTSQDVKYAVERTFARNVLFYGPAYLQTLLGGNAATYPGPYTDRSRNLMGLTAVDTPNATTIVFHLAHPFADFNYVAASPQTAPVPPGRDSGANYQLHPVSTGPYKFASYQLNKQITLVPNTAWNPATDPNASQLASKIVVNLNVNASQIDNRLLAGDIQMDEAGGVQAAAQARIQSNPPLKAQADDPLNGFMWFYYINTKVPPLNNIHCRMAIEYAANKTTLQTAYGGQVAGAIASTAMPSNIVGYRTFDLYHALSQPGGDVAAAKAQLADCGHPNGFTTNIAYLSDRPHDVASSKALQAALATVGIKATLKGYPGSTYYSSTAGSPAYVHSHDLGLAAGGWTADWPDAWSWFDELVNGNAIVRAANTNISELNDPVVNTDLAAMQKATSASVRNSYANKIDMRVMRDAVILPAVYSKSLLYRSSSLTNIYVQSYYGMYNYAVLGRE